MIKEFIPYKEAVALKELGFDGKCLTYYNTYNDFPEFSNGDEYWVNNDFGDNPEFTSAPLYQQAFRWFRDNQGISFFIQDIYPAGCQLNIHNGSDYDQTEYNTYEEAELDCLRKLNELKEKE